MKKIIFALFVFMLFFSCKSISQKMEESFKPSFISANIVLKFIFYIRAETIVPDAFFVQNLNTFKVYQLKTDPENILYYDNLPLGEYRFAYWTGTYSVNKTKIKMFGYANYKFSITETGYFNLGNFRYKCDIDSLVVAPTLIEVVQTARNEPKFLHYRSILLKEESPVDKTELYPTFFYGFAEDLDRHQGETERYLNKAMVFEENLIYSYLKEIDEYYKKNGLDFALILIDKYLNKTQNINFLAKKAKIFYKEQKFLEAEKLFLELLKKDPNSGEYYSYLGEKYFKENDLEKARINLFRAISLRTKDSSTYDLYASILFNENHLEAAKLLSDYSLEFEKDNLTFLKTNLKISEKLGDKKQIEKLTKKIESLHN
ncbi:MAG: hypothetical protein A2086_16620 [Spirochaetes bacterium GWD1_27_9]|nr:MAG: hypothetical protein A2086_16620 [Spirochaetes bacterium GWD1_27_9]